MEGAGRTDVLGAIEIQKAMLEKTGLWPRRNKSAGYKARQIFSWVLDMTFGVTLLMELSLNIKERDYRSLTELISFLASEFPYYFKNLIFTIGHKKLLDALEKLKSPVFTHYPMVCDKYISSSIRFVKIICRCYQFMVVNLVLIYFLKPFLTSAKLAFRWEVYELGVYRMPFHLFQVCAVGLACYNNSTMDLLALGLISIGSSQMRVLIEKLKNVHTWAGLTVNEIDNGEYNEPSGINDEMDAKVQKSIQECVVLHMAIIDYVDTLESIFNQYFLIQFMDSVVAICNSWFQFLVADNILYIAFLIFYTCTLMTQLGIYCFYGNNLMLKSLEVRDACYLSNWYNCGNSVRKSLLIIMERAKRPSVLTAGKFSLLSLASYGSLMQSAYSYFALMNRLYGK